MRPESEAELAEMLRAAQAPIRVIGGGTRAVGHSDAEGRLSTAGLSGITLHEPGALTLVAQAGTPLAEIEAALEAEGQRLAFEPMDMRRLLGSEGTPTIGGAVAANASGPRRISVGACRDFLLGVRFVDGAGRILKNGGRVMKNVTGYDLVKLMAGSWGTLGVLTEVSLKVLPKPEATGVLLYDGLSEEAAVKAMARALGSPFEVSGAAHTPAGLDGTPVTMLRLEGFEDSVSYRLEALQDLLSDLGPCRVERDPARTMAGWRWVRDVEGLANVAGNIWRFSVKPSDAPALAAALAPKAALYDWGGGLIWMALDEAQDPRPTLASFGGHATLARGQGFPAFQPEPAPLAKLSSGLRETFDPRGILNPGLMG